MYIRIYVYIYETYIHHHRKPHQKLPGADWCWSSDSLGWCWSSDSFTSLLFDLQYIIKFELNGPD